MRQSCLVWSDAFRRVGAGAAGGAGLRKMWTPVAPARLRHTADCCCQICHPSGHVLQRWERFRQGQSLGCLPQDLPRSGFACRDVGRTRMAPEWSFRDSTRGSNRVGGILTAGPSWSLAAMALGIDAWTGGGSDP